MCVYVHFSLAKMGCRHAKKIGLLEAHLGSSILELLEWFFNQKSWKLKFKAAALNLSCQPCLGSSNLELPALI